MDKTQAKEAFGKLRKLYPDWKINDVQAQEWLSKLLTISPYIGNKAASYLYSDHPYTNPTLPAFIEAIRKAFAEPGRTEQPRDKTPSAYLICQTNHDHPNRVGWYSPVFFCMPNNEPAPTGHALEQFCERACGKRAEMYGGTWAYLIGWTESQALDQRRKYRAEAGIVEAQPSERMARVFVQACESM